MHMSWPSPKQKDPIYELYTLLMGDAHGRSYKRDRRRRGKYSRGPLKF